MTYNVFGGTLSLTQQPLTRIRVTRYFHNYWTNFNESCHKYSSCEWALLKMFSRSEVKGQGRDQTECYNDGVSSRLTRLCIVVAMGDSPPGGIQGDQCPDPSVAVSSSHAQRA